MYATQKSIFLYGQEIEQSKKKVQSLLYTA